MNEPNFNWITLFICILTIVVVVLAWRGCAKENKEPPQPPHYHDYVGVVYGDEFVSPDGTLYITTKDNILYQYKPSHTYTYVGSWDLSEVNKPTSKRVGFKDDGFILSLWEWKGDELVEYKYVLSTPYDITTATPVDSNLFEVFK